MTMTGPRAEVAGQRENRRRLPAFLALALRRSALSLALCPLTFALLLSLPVAAQKPAPDPVLILETAKGTVEIQLFAAEAPKSVAHIVALVRRSFYRGQRFHRVTPTLAQVGDPRSRDMTYREHWGSGGSGTAINAFEVSKKRTHQRGTVGLGHAGNPMAADSQ